MASNSDSPLTQHREIFACGRRLFTQTALQNPVACKRFTYALIGVVTLLLMGFAAVAILNQCPKNRRRLEKIAWTMPSSLHR